MVGNVFTLGVRITSVRSYSKELTIKSFQWALLFSISTSRDMAQRSRSWIDDRLTKVLFQCCRMKHTQFIRHDDKTLYPFQVLYLSLPKAPPDSTRDSVQSGPKCHLFRVTPTYTVRHINDHTSVSAKHQYSNRHFSWDNHLHRELLRALQPTMFDNSGTYGCGWFVEKRNSPAPVICSCWCSLQSRWIYNSHFHSPNTVTITVQHRVRIIRPTITTATIC